MTDLARLPQATPEQPGAPHSADAPPDDIPQGDGPHDTRHGGLPPPPHRRPVVSTLIALVCLGALAGLGWLLAHRDLSHPAAGRVRQRPVATVGVAVAAHADIPITLEALGTVTPVAAVTVRPQVAGVLKQVLYQEGQQVKRGQVLALIDPQPYKLALQQAEGQLRRDSAELANARVTLKRDRTLLAQDSIARQDVDTQAATVQQLEGTVAADRASVGTARLNLGYTRVTAPISGRVGLRTVDPGNYVTVDDSAGIATITQMTPMDVVFNLPASAVPRVQKQVRSGAVLRVTALDRTLSNTLGQGTFLTLDNQIDPQTGTIRAKARFANAERTLFPNEFVNVRLLLDTVHDAVVVPVSAVRHGPDGDFVFRVTDQDLAQVTPIHTGAAFQDSVQVTSGLSVGDRVVTEGGDRLTNGSPVRLPGQKNRMARSGGGHGHDGGRHGPSIR